MSDRVVLLGTGTCQLQAERRTSSVLVEVGGSRLVFDMGRGIADRLAALPHRDSFPTFPATALSYGLIGGDSDRVGQVQAADPRTDRDPQQTIRISVKNPARQAARFRTEDKRVARLILDIRVTRFGPLGEQPQMRVAQLLQDLVPIGYDLPIQVLPIVEPGAAQVLCVQLKAKRFD